MWSLLRKVTPALMLVAGLMLFVACGSEPEPASQQSAPTQPPTVEADAPATAQQSIEQPKATESMMAKADPTVPSQQAKAPIEPSDPTIVPATEAKAAATPATESKTSAPPFSPVNVVTTTNILADWAQAVGQDRVSVASLLPPNADPHTYQPGARDVGQIADAGLVFSVGLSLEAGWFEELIHNAAGDPEKIIALGEGVDPIDFEEIFEHHDEHDGHDEEEMEEILGRLLIGDGETGAMSVIDLEHGDVDQNAFDMGERAGRIYATKSGRFAIAVSSDADNVHVIDGGIFLEAHGDHFDLVEAPARQMGIDLAGDRPVHLYVGPEWAVIFYDGSGDVVFINEHELEEEGNDYVPPRFNVGPQHGAAVPLEDDLFAISIKHPDYPANPDARRPIGAEIRDLDGNILYSAEGCAELHGDASNGHIAMFGCVGGVLALEAHEGEYSHSFIAVPDESMAEFRLGSVWGYPGSDHFFALGSDVGLFVVEPEEGEMEQLIPATEELRPIQVSFGYGGETLLVVMSDGELRMYDAHDLDLLASASGFLTTPVETGFWARPHIATAAGAVFITDSVGGKVLQLDDHDLEVVEEWEVDGAPTKIAFVGVLGESEGHEEHGHEERGEEKDDAHGHGHGHGELDPHFWFDPLRVKQAVNNIAAQLSTIDPEGQSLYRENAAEYGHALDELHAWIEERVATLPHERRLLVTSHDAFQYFAKRYDFEVVGTIFPISTEAEPTAQELAELIETIEHAGAPGRVH